MKSLKKTQTPIFLSVVCSFFPKAIFWRLFYYTAAGISAVLRNLLLYRILYEQIYMYERPFFFFFFFFLHYENTPIQIYRKFHLQK